MMTAEQFDRWVTALRSGEYEQGHSHLRTGGTESGYAYCCLGLFCHIEGLNLGEPTSTTNSEGVHPKDIGDPLGDLGGVSDAPMLLVEAITEAWRDDLAQMNDEGCTFAEIADHLEANRAEFVR